MTAEWMAYGRTFFGRIAGKLRAADGRRLLFMCQDEGDDHCKTVIADTRPATDVINFCHYFFE